MSELVTGGYNCNGMMIYEKEGCRCVSMKERAKMHQHFAIKSALSDLFGDNEEERGVGDAIFSTFQGTPTNKDCCQKTISREDSHDSCDSKRNSFCTTSDSMSISSIRNPFQNIRLSPSHLFDPVFVSHSNAQLNFETSDKLVYQVL